jgi:hypothetical protein
MTTTISKHSAKAIKEIADAISDGMRSWRIAGEKIMSLVDDGMDFDEIAAMIGVPGISANVIAQFDRIGRGLASPRMIVSAFPAAKAMLSLPASEQDRLLDSSVEVVVVSPAGADVLQINPANLTRSQSAQVFGPSGIRDAAAQRAYIASRTTAESIKAGSSIEPMPYVIERGKIRFRSGCELSRHELAIILAQLS